MTSRDSASWFAVANQSEIDSPALLLYPDRIRRNIEMMIAMVGDKSRLRPHVKTHKLAEVVALQQELGLTRFKAATIAEAEMLGMAGAPDVLLAYPLTGPNQARFVTLMKKFPKTRFAAVADDSGAIRELGAIADRAGVVAEVLLEIDCGQHRTGVPPGPGAADLYRLLASTRGVVPGGLHAYDGHIHQSDPEIRRREAEAVEDAVRALGNDLTQAGFSVPRRVVGGTPTFPIHARHPDVECSPGTCVLWDHGYGEAYPEMKFLPSALVLTRVVSKPGENRLCLDLGHKAIASENPPPRVFFLNLQSARPVGHSEEHLVVESAEAARWKVGDCLYGVPRHICPTVALHGEAVVIENGRAARRWRILARDRKLTI